MSPKEIERRRALLHSVSAAVEHKPLVSGEYTCTLDAARRWQSPNSNPAVKLRFKVVTPAEYAGQVIGMTVWLTEEAISTGLPQRDLPKIGAGDDHIIDPSLPIPQTAVGSSFFVVYDEEAGQGVVKFEAIEAANQKE